MSLSESSWDSRTVQWVRAAAVCGIAGQAIFVALWIIWGFIERNYEVARQDISDFGALDATHPLPYNVILSITGLLTLVFAAGLYRALRPGVLAAAGCAAVAVFSIGEFLDGLLREDCSPSGNAACKRAADAGDLSWHHTAHDLESVVTIASVVAALFLLGFAYRRRDAWRPIATYMLISGVATAGFVVAYGVLFAANDGSAVSGLLERAAAAVAVAGLAVSAWWLWRVAGEHASSTASVLPSATAPASPGAS